MSAATAVRTAVYFHCLVIAILLFAFRPDMAQFPPVMADVVMLILKDCVCHVVIFPDVFFISTRLPFLMILEFDKASDPILLQIQ